MNTIRVTIFFNQNQAIKQRIQITGETPPNLTERKKELCKICYGKGIITPLLNEKMLRDCSFCGGKGYFMVKTLITPAKGFYSRFKSFLGL